MTTGHRWEFGLAAVTVVIAASVFSSRTAVAQSTSRLPATKPADARPVITAYNCTKPGAPVAADVVWKADDGAVKWGEWRVRVGEKKLPVLVIVTIVAPRRTQLSLDIAREGDNLGAWSVSSAPISARFAVNAGQFTDAGPWGWVVHRGREQQKPGSGALAGALVVDTAGKWSLIDANDITMHRLSLGVREAVQSYPTLINSAGRIPSELCAGSKGVDLEHRDTRLVVGTVPTGELVLAMTRFDGLGETAERLPIGPTSPEMIEVMRALGATRALMLDGGLSAQMMVRTATNARPREWAGLRKVPLALVGLPTPTPPPPRD